MLSGVGFFATLLPEFIAKKSSPAVVRRFLEVAFPEVSLKICH